MLLDITPWKKEERIETCAQKARRHDKRDALRTTAEGLTGPASSYRGQAAAAGGPRALGVCHASPPMPEFVDAIGSNRRARRLLNVAPPCRRMTLPSGAASTRIVGTRRGGRAPRGVAVIARAPAAGRRAGPSLDRPPRPRTCRKMSAQTLPAGGQPLGGIGRPMEEKHRGGFRSRGTGDLVRRGPEHRRGRASKPAGRPRPAPRPRRSPQSFPCSPSNSFRGRQRP
jgi:hypothetical protein